MRNLNHISAEKILALNVPESLFSKSSAQAKQEYRTLVRRWHPDIERSSNASRVFAHIAHLYGLARKKLYDGTWNEPPEKTEEEVAGQRKFKTLGGETKSINYDVAHPFELGTMYVSDHSVTFEVQSEYKDLFRNGRKRIRELKFQNRAMALEMGSCLPQIVDSYRTQESSLLVIRKTPDQLLLADVATHFGGQLIPEHVGWILNALYNICCYLQWSGITHNAMSLDTVFVSPLRHSGMPLGGWWYAAAVDKELLAVPDKTLPFIPPDVLRNKRADTRVDLELIKSIGRALLGDAVGAHLVLDKSFPPKLIQWLRLPSSGCAADDYRDWKYEVLENCFGRPRFLKLPLDSEVLYKEK